GTPRRGSRSAAAPCRSARGCRRAPASAGRPTRSAASPPPRGRCPSRRDASSLPFRPSSVSLSRCQKPLVLALLPFNPGQIVGACEPRVDRPTQLGLAAEPRRERHVRDLEAEAAAEPPERAELVQLAQA